MDEIRLINSCKVKVRFSEVDSMAVVWHGNYVKYLEDGREAFGLQFGVGYNEIFANGYMTPVVKMELNYTRSVKYGEDLIVETTFVNSESAKIIFDYRILRALNNEVVLKARTVQVFVDMQGIMELSKPAFYTEWKKKNGLI